MLDSERRRQEMNELLDHMALALEARRSVNLVGEWFKPEGERDDLRDLCMDRIGAFATALDSYVEARIREREGEQ